MKKRNVKDPFTAATGMLKNYSNNYTYLTPQTLTGVVGLAKQIGDAINLETAAILKSNITTIGMLNKFVDYTPAPVVQRNLTRNLAYIALFFLILLTIILNAPRLKHRQ